MKQTITISLCDRPEYTEKVLRNLLLCRDVDRYNIHMFLEPVCFDVMSLAEQFSTVHNNMAKGKGGTEVHINKKRLGCSFNVYQCLWYAFDKLGSEYNIHIEDDIVPSKDFLQYTDWCRTKYVDDKDVFSICGYERTEEKDLDKSSTVSKHSWFTPWGWATWSDRWNDGYKQELWKRIQQKYLLETKVYHSWDTHTLNIREGKLEVRPTVARTQNIGALGGVHIDSIELHNKHYFNPNWIESTGKYTKVFKENKE